MDMGGLVGALIAVGIIGGILALAHWSNHKDKQRAARRTIIDTTYDRPSLQQPRPPARKVPVEKRPPAKPEPTYETESAIEHFVAEGIHAAQFMLDKLWRQKGHDQT